jgi:carboxypeptidase family protein
MRPHLRSLALPIVISLLLAACAGSAGSTTGPTPAVSGAPIRVDSPAAAATRVISAHPEFAGLLPLDNDRIGQCCWYEAVEAPGGYRVTIHVGWGDCPAGCIEKHEWAYSVSAGEGVIRLLGEQGPAVPAGILKDAGGPGTGIVGTAVAGPTCPVVRENDPSCDPRPVPGVTLVVKTLDGREVATGQTDAAGRFAFEVPAGNYTLEAQQAQPFPLAPAPVAVTVLANVRTDVTLEFDTGIR